MRFHVKNESTDRLPENILFDHHLGSLARGFGTWPLRSPAPSSAVLGALSGDRVEWMERVVALVVLQTPFGCLGSNICGCPLDRIHEV